MLHYLDTQYAYQLAKRMEAIRSNPVLGYRTAGSKAERETGDLLAEEMRRIGLQNVRKDEITADAWEFHHAILTYTDAMGRRREVQLGAYQTQLVTDGFEPMELVYLGKGTAADYEGRDVRGKLVLVDINQRADWWINYPAYEAHLAGAAAVIAVQDGVRPLGSVAMIRRVAEAAAKHGAAIPVVEPVDSFRETDGEADAAGRAASHIVDRRLLRIVQTPQIFRAEVLRRAYESEYRAEFTDDASVVEAVGQAVCLAEGERENDPRGFRHRRSVDRRTRRGRKRRRDYRCRARINTASITARSTGR